MRPISERTSYHEAGHAIVSALVAQSKGAEIKSEGYEGTSWSFGCLDVVSRIAISAAGSLAEWELGLRKGTRLGEASNTDLQNIDNALWRFHKRKIERESTPEFWRGVQLAGDLLWAHWGAVEHVARRLVSQEKISGALVHAVLAVHQRKLEEQNVSHSNRSSEQYAYTG
jgi:hypothetical protein